MLAPRQIGLAVAYNATAQVPERCREFLADLVAHAIEEDRGQRDEALVAIIGNMIDQWEIAPNDLLGSIEDSAPGLARAMDKLIKHLTKSS